MNLSHLTAAGFGAGIQTIYIVGVGNEKFQTLKNKRKKV